MSMNAWGGLFKQQMRLSIEQKESVDKILGSKDPEFIKGFEHIIKTIEEDLNELKNDDEHYDQALIDSVFEHYRKYTDDSTESEAIDNFIENRIDSIFTGTSKGEEERYYPERFNKRLPKMGGWIMVVDEIPVSEEARPVTYSVYFAKPDLIINKLKLEETFRRKSKEVSIPYYRVLITTENGTKLNLWPHEYIYIQNIDNVTEEVGNSFEIVRLGGDTNYDNAKVHYLGTRGIDQSGVYRLLMNSINALDFMYFKILPGKPTEFWTHYIRCLRLGATPDMAIREWNMLEAGMTHYPIKIIDKTKNNADKSTVRKSRAKTNTVKHKPKSTTGERSGITRKKR